MLHQRFVLGDKSDITLWSGWYHLLHKYVQDNSTKEALIDDYNFACYSTKEVIAQNFGGLLLKHFGRKNIAGLTDLHSKLARIMHNCWQTGHEPQIWQSFLLPEFCGKLTVGCLWLWDYILMFPWCLYNAL